jgi:hypothetical protein
LLGKENFWYVNEFHKSINEEAHLSSKESWERLVGKGRVFCSYVAEDDSTPSRSKLLKVLQYGFMVACKNNQKGTDMVLPVLLPNKDNVYALLEENICPLFIQTKNLQASKSITFEREILEKMTPNYTGICKGDSKNPYMAIYMQLATSKKTSPHVGLPDVEHLQKGQCAFACFGIGATLYPFLDAEVTTILKDTLKGRPSPMQRCKEDLVEEYGGDDIEPPIKTRTAMAFKQWKQNTFPQGDKVELWPYLQHN